MTEYTFMRPEDVIQAARGWIGTPYHHRQLVKGTRGGTDCIGLVVGVHNELYPNPIRIEDIPVYTPWWAEESGMETLVQELQRHPHCISISVADMMPGDVFVMRMKYDGPAKHCGFYSYDSRIIHAYSGHEVLETDIPPGWKQRIRYAFRFVKETA